MGARPAGTPQSRRTGGRRRARAEGGCRSFPPAGVTRRAGPVGRRPADLRLPGLPAPRGPAPLALGGRAEGTPELHLPFGPAGSGPRGRARKHPRSGPRRGGEAREPPSHSRLPRQWCHPLPPPWCWPPVHVAVVQPAAPTCARAVGLFPPPRGSSGFFLPPAPRQWYGPVVKRRAGRGRAAVGPCRPR